MKLPTRRGLNSALSAASWKLRENGEEWVKNNKDGEEKINETENRDKRDEWQAERIDQ